MTRHHKSNRRKTRKERFAFAPLEPRLLLAGDVTTISIYAPDFIGPTVTAPSEISCAVEHPGGDDAGKDAASDVEFQTAECSPTLMRLDFAFSQADSLNADYEFDYRQEVGSRIVWDGSTRTFNYAGNSNQTIDTWRYDIIDASNYVEFNLDARATRITSSSGTINLDQPISIPAESRSFKGSNDFDISADITEGKYFQIESTAALDSSALNVESTSLEYSDNSTSGIGVISQRQMFALVSPDTIGIANSVQGFTVKSQLSTRVLASASLAPARIQTTTAFAPLESRDTSLSQSDSSSNRAQVGFHFQEQLEPRMISVREMLVSENDQTNRLSQQRMVTSNGIRTSFTSMVYERIFEPFNQVESTAHAVVARSPGIVQDGAEGDVKLARSIQILESAIILIGLPSSRLCREEESSLRKKSV